VDLRRVLDSDHVLALASGVAELRHRGRGVFEQASLERGVGPGARHHAGAITRAHLRLVAVDELVERRGIDETFLDEQRLERLDPQRGPGERGAVLARGVVVVVVIVIMVVVVVVMVAAHGLLRWRWGAPHPRTRTPRRSW
jgi:hypothetical protein